ncbi:MAG: chorismate synthase [Kiritimatiellae bacterium]|nr:chorismate synthase [Kiritimatiellia bacterium]
MSSTIGKLFSVTTFGESHGSSVGAVVDGCPAGLELAESDIQSQLARRRPGQSSLTTARDESDKVRILSGVEAGVTLGSPIALVVENLDKRPSDYSELVKTPRPSHADMTYREKYGISASSGGGRASARETVGRVAGGAVAEKYLIDRYGIEIVAWVSAVGSVSAPDMTDADITRDKVDSNDVRCPDSESAERMIAEIHDAADKKDSVGGIVTCVCRNIPAGWGEPVFDKIEALLAHAVMSIPAVKGFDIGSGFAGAGMRGSEHNDMFTMKGDRLGTVTNRSGGVQGGITNGEPIVFRVAIKPVATIGQPQDTIDYEGAPVTLKIEKGRHDPCVLPRAVPIVEAMAAIVLADASK